MLVANKSEGRAAEEGFYAAFELGFGEPVAISAEHGEGLGDLEARHAGRARAEADACKTRRRRPSEAPATSRPIRVAIVGRPNAGKSTLVNAFLGEERMITGPEPGLTRDAVSSDLEWSGRKVRLFDTAGLRRKAKVTRDRREARRERRHPRHPLRRGGRAARSTPSARSSIRI